jgi:predicted RNA binding protein YcfA (HicA-like mRNA interferase family)
MTLQRMLRIAEVAVGPFSPCRWRRDVKFSELVKLLEEAEFRIVKEKGSIRYYRKSGWDKLIRVDYHGAKEVPAGTCHAILKDAGIKHP